MTRQHEHFLGDLRERPLVADLGRLALERRLVSELGRLAWKRPLVADLGNLAWERPLVANLGSLALEVPLVANMGRLRAKRALLIWPSKARHQIQGIKRGGGAPFSSCPPPEGRGCS